MKFFLFSILCLLMACGGTAQNHKGNSLNKGQLLQEIEALEQTVMTDTTLQVDRAIAERLIEKSLLFVDKFPNDSQSAGYLFKTAELYVGIGSYQQAVQCFARMQQEYAKHPKVPTALFLQGFTFENHLQDVSNAKKCYSAFLQQYPKHELAEQVTLLLKNLDKSPEDLIREFQKQE